MSESGSNKKVSNGLVALSSAAVLVVYGAGYARTRAAADRFADRAQERRPHVPLRSASATPEPPHVDTARTPEQPRSPVARLTAASAPIAETSVAPTVTAARESAGPARQKTARREHAAETGVAPRAARPPVAPAPAVSPTATPVTDADADAAAPAPSAAPSTPATPAVAASAAAPAAAKYRDGTYLGWGTSRHGDIQVAVVVEDGRITAARVAQCLTRYSCSWVSPIPPVILKQQGPTYDYVSGATESSDAFQTAVADALSHAL